MPPPSPRVRTVAEPAALAFDWNRDAPERVADLPSAWSLLPSDLSALGCPARVEHVFARLQRVRDWTGTEDSDFAPFLARPILGWLRERTDLTLPRIVARLPSLDGSTKLVFELGDGHRIEAVHMPRRETGGRVTFCLSSQVGCALACSFCATGAMGIARNLTAGEIVGQVLVLMRELGPARGDRVFLVFMGMGEPLHNLDHVHRAIRVLCARDPEGAGLSPRRITVSTAGLVPGIERLANLRPRPQLAISLNAASDDLRARLMPINRAFDLARLRRALDRWALDPGERLSFEVVMLAGVNDRLEDADRLAEWLGDLRHRHCVNLIPWNEHPHSPYREPSEETLRAFSDRLSAKGCFVTLRRSRGRDVQAACGQLIERVG